MRLPGAYRSLARSSSAPEPSHPPSGLCTVTLHSLYLNPMLTFINPDKDFSPSLMILNHQVHNEQKNYSNTLYI